MATLIDGFDIRFEAKALEYKLSQGIQASPLQHPHVFSFFQRFEYGTGSGKVNCIWSQPPTAVVNGAPQDIDLRGTLTSVVDGSVVDFPLIVGIFIVNHSTTSGQYVTVGAGSNPFIDWLTASGDGVRAKPGPGFLNLWSPLDAYQTTAGTADILRLASAAGSPQCSVLIVGRSA